MVKVRHDLTGQVFGRLTVLSQIDDHISSSGERRSKWLCKCICGNKVEVVGKNLKDKKVTSCGCYKSESLAEKNKLEKKKYNLFSEKLFDEHGEYYIGYTDNTGAEFYIDADDYESVKGHCWCDFEHHGGRRLTTNINGETVDFHKFIGFKYHDHIDRNRLNNRRYNFRPCTNKENTRNRSLQSNNTSGFTGVRLDKRSGRWTAHIKVDGKSIYLGSSINKDDAIRKRLQAEVKYFKEFAPQRHLFEQYGIETYN